MADIVNYSQRENILFEVGVADVLSKGYVSQILTDAMGTTSNFHIRCYEATHETLLERLSKHRLDMILSDCPIDSSKLPGIYSKKHREVSMSFYASKKMDLSSFPHSLNGAKLLIPTQNTALGRNIMHWLEVRSIDVEVLGEFDDLALLKAFAAEHGSCVYVAPSSYQYELDFCDTHQMIGTVNDLKEEYHAIFADRMVQHPVVKNNF